MRTRCASCSAWCRIDDPEKDTYCWNCDSLLSIEGLKVPKGASVQVKDESYLDLKGAFEQITVQGVPYKINWKSAEAMSEPVGVEISTPDSPVKTVPANGVIDFNQQRIDLNRDIPLQSKRVVLVHEILHACLYQLGRDDNEDLIHALAYLLVDTMQQNKHIFITIIEKK